MKQELWKEGLGWEGWGRRGPGQVGDVWGNVVEVMLALCVAVVAVAVAVLVVV